MIIDNKHLKEGLVFCYGPSPMNSILDYVEITYDYLSKNQLKTLLTSVRDLGYNDGDEYIKCFNKLDKEDIKNVIELLFDELDKGIEKVKKEEYKNRLLIADNVFTYESLIFVIELLEERKVDVTNYVLKAIEKRKNNPKCFVDGTNKLYNLFDYFEYSKSKTFTDGLLNYIVGEGNEINEKNIKKMGEDVVSDFNYIYNKTAHKFCSSLISFNDSSNLINFLDRLLISLELYNCFKSLETMIHESNMDKVIKYYDDLCKENKEVLKR